MSVELKTSEIVVRLRPLEASFRARGVESLAMFGSRARGDYNPDSDLDLLVGLKRDSVFSLLDLASLAAEASDATGLQANPVIADDLRPLVRKRLADDLLPIF